MACPRCGNPLLAFPVPPALSGVLPDDRPGAAICTTCLAVVPDDHPPDDLPDFTAVSDAFPPEPDRGVVLAVLLALLDSPATYHSELETVVTHAEDRGLDVLLFLDRINHDHTLAPHFDVERRSTQLEQLLR